MTRPDIDAGIFDVEAAAAFLGISTKAVYVGAYDVRKAAERRPYQTIPGIKIARKWRFNRDVLDAVVRGEYSPPTPTVTPMRQRRSA